MSDQIDHKLANEEEYGVEAITSNKQDDKVTSAAASSVQSDFEIQAIAESNEEPTNEDEDEI
jgi:hypothetical protein